MILCFGLKISIPKEIMKKGFLFLFSVFLFSACKKSGGTTNNNNLPPVDTTATTSFFAKGSDVSWVTQMEASGIKFYNSNGAEQDLFLILKNLGINSIR